MRTVRLLISGTVQGVFFRVYAKIHAKELDITGYVRNLPNGKVEVLAQGEKIEEFMRHMHRGSQGSKVDDIKSWDVDEPEKYKEFKIM